jgi:signal transduction histidine kinase
MGHDINNLNQVALGYLEVAEEALKDKGLKELIARPLEAIKSSSHLIENVNNLKKLKAGGLNVEAIDMCKILTAVQSQYSAVQDKDVVIDYHPCDPACIVIANGLVYDVFSNLVWNSIKHSEKPSVHITLGLKRLKEGGKDHCKITVEDDGPGIPDEMKEKLFTRFQRGNTKASGKGLGLYLVKTLVEDFHGRVWVEDRVQGDHGQGSRFVVILPAIDK